MRAYCDRQGVILLSTISPVRGWLLLGDDSGVNRATMRDVLVLAGAQERTHYRSGRQIGGRALVVPWFEIQKTESERKICAARFAARVRELLELWRQCTAAGSTLDDDDAKLAGRV